MADETVLVVREWGPDFIFETHSVAVRDEHNAVVRALIERDAQLASVGTALAVTEVQLSAMTAERDAQVELTLTVHASFEFELQKRLELEAKLTASEAARGTARADALREAAASLRAISWRDAHIMDSEAFAEWIEALVAASEPHP